MNGIVVCVEFDDLLTVTLPWNADHFDRIFVVSSPDDRATRNVVSRTPNAELYTTDAFYRNGATFNKGLALEEGFDVLGRSGWIVVWDADILMPKQMDVAGVEAGRLYCPRRRICRDPGEWWGQTNWAGWPRYDDGEHAGYFQLFHADDPLLVQRPWYGTDWTHAGGCDSDFQAKWPPNKKAWLPFDVLHLGEHGQNWCGRCTDRLDGKNLPNAERRRNAMERMLASRRKTGLAEERLA